MSEPTRRFRPATPSDAAAVLELMAGYYAGDGYAFSADSARKELGCFLANPGLGSLFVAVVDGQVVGYLVVTLGFSFEYHGRDAFIDELYVAAPFRGQGLGREAMACAEAYCHRVGVRAIHLEVEPQRTTAAALYERNGFRATGRTLMTRRLALDEEPG